MPLRVVVPATYLPERIYVVQTVLEEFLGLECQVFPESRADTCITLEGAHGELVVPDGLFSIAEPAWLGEASVPKAPVGTFAPSRHGLPAKLVEAELPVLFDARRGESEWVELSPGRCVLKFDPLGTVFFLLSRYEEVASPVRDPHDRFPAQADLAFRSGFLDRPLVDEYVEVIWAALSRLWPVLDRRARAFRMVPTHDVDIPFQHAFTSMPRMLLSCGADCIRRRDVPAALRRITAWARTKRGDPTADPANTFDLLMDMSERAGLVSEFNFIVDHTVAYYDAHYDIRHPWILDLMRRIHDRGHMIGLHASYGSYLDSAQTVREFGILKETCERLGIRQHRWGGRQHWLRFRVPDTFQNWEDAGLDFDSTLTYERSIGFRSGTCREYPVFNLRRRRRLRLTERPTVVMDASVTDPGTMNLGVGEAAAAAIRRVVERCRVVNGDCVILWHNSRLTRGEDIELYRRVLEA
jgi:hypothetical protein